jgi:hypothetical protein
MLAIKLKFQFLEGFGFRNKAYYKFNSILLISVV